MRPKQLKYPYLGEERPVFIKDRVWYVPDFFANYEAFSFPGWSDPMLFGNEQPVFVEYCSGNGAWIAEKARENPHYNWVAVEKNFKRVRKIWSKVKNYDLNNLVVISGEAYTVTQRYFPKESLAGVYINFPDPWPKKRHAKNRLIQPAFVELLAQMMVPDANFYLVTDDPDYSSLAVEVLLQNSAFTPVDAEPHYVAELENYGTSYFETLWRDKGKEIRYHRFLRHERKRSKNF